MKGKKNRSKDCIKMQSILRKYSLNMGRLTTCPFLLTILIAYDILISLIDNNNIRRVMEQARIKKSHKNC